MVDSTSILEPSNKHTRLSLTLNYLAPPLPTTIHLLSSSEAPPSPEPTPPFFFFLSLDHLRHRTMVVLDRILPSPGEVPTTAFSFANLVILVALGLLGYFSVSIYTTWRRLRHIPGPRSAGFSKWWMLRNTLGGSMHLALKAACDTYGKETPSQKPGSRFSGHFPHQTPNKTCR